MDEYQFARALTYDFGALANMFTEAFTGYFFPMNMTPEALANHWRLYHIDGARSMVMRDEEGTFVGMTLIGVRGTRGWCGGFGIAPAFRGHAAGKRLARAMVETARASDLRSLQLEVLSQSEPARAIYESAGLTVRRRVRTVELAIAALPDGAERSPAGSRHPRRWWLRMSWPRSQSGSKNWLACSPSRPRQRMSLTALVSAVRWSACALARQHAFSRPAWRSRSPSRSWSRSSGRRRVSHNYPVHKLPRQQLDPGTLPGARLHRGLQPG